MNRESTLRANLGPTPLIPINVPKAARASGVRKPKRVRLSSLTCREVYSLTRPPVRPNCSGADAGTLTRSVTPPDREVHPVGAERFDGSLDG